ncbi:substrate-binding periplasmic protein [Andreprevotia chitinilytica]|uniref:substrate-binding periplasmic protein n=1 Tax=Andreprevotia chitinilytica TaxID=396808 RepID=UPI00055120F8|nr:transporter substrate-binding domain-containing protein [Andreprevotia chitinilytica]
MRALLLIAAFPLIAHAAGPIRICAEDDWAPFSFIEKGHAQGASVDLVNAALHSEGMDVQFESGTYNRCLNLTRQGNYHALVDVAQNKERRPQFLWPEKPLLIMRLHLVARKGLAVKTPGYAAMARHRVGITSGYEYPDVMLGQPGLMKVESHSELGNLRQLANGKIDFMLLSEGTIASLRKELTEDERQAVQDLGEIDQLALYVAFNKDAPQAAAWAQALDRGLTTLGRNGEAQRIMARWKAVP